MPSLLLILGTALVVLNAFALGSEALFARLTGEAMHPGIVAESAFALLIGAAILVAYL